MRWPWQKKGVDGGGDVGAGGDTAAAGVDGTPPLPVSSPRTATDDGGSIAPPPIAAAPSRPRGEWATLAAPELTAAAPTAVTGLQTFVTTLPTRWQVPAVLAPLSHDVREEAPAGVVEVPTLAVPPATVGGAHDGPPLVLRDAPVHDAHDEPPTRRRWWQRTEPTPPPVEPSAPTAPPPEAVDVMAGQAAPSTWAPVSPAVPEGWPDGGSASSAGNATVPLGSGTAATPASEGWGATDTIDGFGDRAASRDVDAAAFGLGVDAGALGLGVEAGALGLGVGAEGAHDLGIDAAALDAAAPDAAALDAAALDAAGREGAGVDAAHDLAGLDGTQAPLLGSGSPTSATDAAGVERAAAAWGDLALPLRPVAGAGAGDGGSTAEQLRATPAFADLATTAAPNLSADALAALLEAAGAPGESAAAPGSATAPSMPATAQPSLAPADSAPTEAPPSRRLGSAPLVGLTRLLADTASATPTTAVAPTRAQQPGRSEAPAGPFGAPTSARPESGPSIPLGLTGSMSSSAAAALARAMGTDVSALLPAATDASVSPLVELDSEAAAPGLPSWVDPDRAGDRAVGSPLADGTIEADGPAGVDGPADAGWTTRPAPHAPHATDPATSPEQAGPVGPVVTRRAEPLWQSGWRGRGMEAGPLHPPAPASEPAAPVDVATTPLPPTPAPEPAAASANLSPETLAALRDATAPPAPQAPAPVGAPQIMDSLDLPLLRPPAPRVPDPAEPSASHGGGTVVAAPLQLVRRPGAGAALAAAATAHAGFGFDLAPDAHEAASPAPPDAGPSPIPVATAPAPAPDDGTPAPADTVATAGGDGEADPHAAMRDLPPVELDRLAARLYDRIADRMRRDLVIGRERRASLNDLD